MRCKKPAFGQRTIRKAIESLEDRVLLSSWYVAASGGSTSNPGTLAQPFLKIQQAANVAMPGDTVFIETGYYRETVTPVNSGTPGNPITYEPYNGESVTIEGGDNIGGWTKYSGNIYQAKQSWDLGDGNNQVFDNGVLLSQATWPTNTSTNPMFPTTATITSTNAAPATQDTQTSATIYNASLTQAAGYWVGATIHISPGQQWIWQTGTVTASAPGSITYSYTQLTSYEVPTAGNPFYLTGLLSQLTAPGEFFHDAANNTLYVWAPNGLTPSGIDSKHREYAFDLSGLGYINIQGLNVHADSINTDATSNNINISGSSFTYVSQQLDDAYPWGAKYAAGTTGLLINGTNITLSNDSVVNSSGNGVYLGGSNNIVEDCTISGIDYGGGDEAAVNVRGTNNLVSHNTISNTGRSGITFYFSPQTQIFNNIIHDIGLRGSDSGGVYAWKTDGMGSEISQNVIYNAYQGGYGNSGILLDNNDSNIIIDHNIVYDADAALKMNGVSMNDLVYNNTLLSGVNPNPVIVPLINPPSALIEGASPTMPGTEIVNDILIGPVMYASGAIHSNDLTSDALAMFVDEANANFQLMAGSAAIDMGALLPPYTNGYVGAAPDIGAEEFGGQPIQAGPSSGAQIIATPPSNQSATQNTAASIQLGSFSATGATAPFTVTVNWGDGSANTVISLPAAGAIPSTGHVFPGAGMFSPSVTVTDSSTNRSNTASFIVNVALVSTSPPTQLTFSQQPTGVDTNSAISPAVTVLIQDADGITVSPTDSSLTTVAIAIATGPVGGTLGGTTAAIAQSGVATFSNLVFSLPGTYTLIATDPTLTSATSTSFTVVDATPVQLAFAQQPTGAMTGTVFSPALTVAIENAEGNPVTPTNPQFGNVTLSIASGPGGATLGGTTTVAEQAGVATFSGISISMPGTYTLIVADGTLATATSQSFTISAPASASSTVTLSSSAPTTTQYQVVNFYANVTSAQSVPVPTGMVNFFDGQTLLGSIAVNAAGTAQFTTSTLTAGAHSITATYVGNTSFPAGTSTVLTQTINPLAAGSQLLVPAIVHAKVPPTLVEGTKNTSVLPILIANQGTGASGGAFTVTVYVSQNQTFDSTAVSILSFSHSLKLKPGASKIVPAKPGPLPSTLTNGTYYYLIQVVDPIGSTTVSAPSAPMQVAAPIVTLSVGIGAVTPAAIAAGKHGVAIVTISNSGNVAAAGVATINLGLSSDGTTVAASLLTLPHPVKIKPNAAMKLVLHFTRTSQAAGTYFPGVSVSLNGQEASTIGTMMLTLL